MATKKIFVIDPGSTGIPNGHHYATNLLLAEECFNRGVELAILAHCSFQASQAMPVVRKATQNVLHMQHYSANNLDPVNSGSTVEFFVCAYSLHADLQKHLTPQLARNSLVFCHTGSAAILYGIYKWAVELSPDLQPEIIVNIQAHIADHEVAESLYSHAMTLVRRLPNARVFGSNEAVCRLLQRYSKSEVNIFPLPYAHMELPPKKQNAAPLFGAIGQCRPEKNYQLLLPAVHKYLERGGRGNFLFQIGCQEAPYLQYFFHEIQRELESLNKAFPNRVHIKMHDVYGEEYYALLAGCDAVLLPYEPDVYKVRISQVVMDCIFLGVPVIAPRHTSLGDELTRFQAGAVLLDDLGENTLVDALFCFEAQQKVRSAQAAEGARTMSSYYNKDSYMDILLSNGNNPLPAIASLRVPGCASEREKNTTGDVCAF